MDLVDTLRDDWISWGSAGGAPPLPPVPEAPLPLRATMVVETGSGIIEMEGTLLRRLATAAAVAASVPIYVGPPLEDLLPPVGLACCISRRSLGLSVVAAVYSQRLSNVRISPSLKTLNTHTFTWFIA